MSLPHPPKLYDLPSLLKLIKTWEIKSQRIVFTNGCFDILHPGHVKYLEDAKALGNRLILGLNTDASVRRQNKGEERPLNEEWARAFVLGGLTSVDAIVLFDEDTPLKLIQAIQPNVLVKGGDYDETSTNENDSKYIVGSKEVLKSGGIVKTIPFVTGFSTTRLVEKIKNSDV